MIRCCFCRHETGGRTVSGVSLCDGCARATKPGDLPSFAVWVRRETIAQQIAPVRDEPLLVTHDGEVGPPQDCCFCRAPTPYWFLSKDVAVCLACAARAAPDDVPKKVDWLRGERIAG